MITLLIIGVVASLVIPAIIQNTQDAELKAAWKKNFAALSQATLQIKNDNGGTLTGYFIDNDDITLKYASYLNALKTYSSSSLFCGGGWPKTIYNSDGSSVTCSQATGLLLNDGAAIVVARTSQDCTTNNVALTFGTYAALTTTFCGDLFVDVNGPKNPNTLGKDIFAVLVLPDRVVPYNTTIMGVNSSNTKYMTLLNSSNYLSQ